MVASRTTASILSPFNTAWISRTGTAGAGGTVGSNGFNYNSQGWQNATFYTPGAPLGVWVGISYSFGGRNKTDKD